MRNNKLIQDLIKELKNLFLRLKRNTDKLTKDELGKYGERIAEKYLKKNGYNILEKNFKCIYGEIDIIAKESNCIVFIEVKTRRRIKSMLPEDSVGFMKQKHLKKVAEYYLHKRNNEDAVYRFDVVSVELSKGCSQIYLVRDVI